MLKPCWVELRIHRFYWMDCCEHLARDRFAKFGTASARDGVSQMLNQPPPVYDSLTRYTHTVLLRVYGQTHPTLRATHRTRCRVLQYPDTTYSSTRSTLSSTLPMATCLAFLRLGPKVYQVYNLMAEYVALVATTTADLHENDQHTTAAGPTAAALRLRHRAAPRHSSCCSSRRGRAAAAATRAAAAAARAGLAGACTARC